MSEIPPSSSINPAIPEGGMSGSLMPTAAVDAPLPATRSLEDALALLTEIERGAIEVFARHGLPTQPGLYRQEEPGGPWSLMDKPHSTEERWEMILSRPPEAGFRYLSLAEIGRLERPGDADVLAAAATLDRSWDLRRLLEGPEGPELDAATLMFWSTAELLAVLFGGPNRRGDSRQAGRRAVEWEIWRAEARRVWEAEPLLSARTVAQLVVDRLGLAESHHSVRRRLSGYRPLGASSEA